MPDKSQDESRIVRAIEKAISWANSGCSPNEAIQKVAEEEQFSPVFIARMVEAFNKSKSVHVLKTASEEERAKPFELADTGVIIDSIFNKAEPLEKAACKVPSQDFSQLGLTETSMQKVAEAEARPESIPVHSFARRLEKYASFCGKVLETLSFKVAERRRAFNTRLEKAAEEIKKLPHTRLPKLAQTIINGYPETGPKLLKVLASYTRCDLPIRDKTAHGVVFPAQEPYMAIADVYTAADLWANAVNAQRLFEKDAKEGRGLFDAFLRGEGEFGQVKTAAAAGKGGLGSIYHSFLGSSIAAAGQLADEDKEEEKLIDVVEPGVFNRLKELEARRALMQLVLYDPELSTYEMPELVKAYNEAVGSVPDAYRHSSVLKNLMLQNLETGGVKDPYQLQQEVTLGKNLAQMQQARSTAEKETITPEKA